MATVEIEVTPELIELVKRREDLVYGRVKLEDFMKEYNEVCKLLCMEILRFRVENAIKKLEGSV